MPRVRYGTHSANRAAISVARESERARERETESVCERERGI